MRTPGRESEQLLVVEDYGRANINNNLQDVGWHVSSYVLMYDGRTQAPGNMLFRNKGSPFQTTVGDDLCTQIVALTTESGAFSYARVLSELWARLAFWWALIYESASLYKAS